MVTSTTVPEIRNKTIKEAKKILKEIGLQLEANNIEVNEDTIIVEQTPKPGININTGGKIYIEI